MKRSQQWTKPAALVGLIVILGLLPLMIHGQKYYLHVLTMTLIYVIVVSSLRTVALSGQISVGHAAFMGIGAYFSGCVAKEVGWPPWLTIVLGGLVAMAIAVVVGYPFTRVRAMYFSMVSLFAGIAIVDLVRVAEKWTGAAGLANIPPLTASFANKEMPYYYTTLALVMVCLAILYRIEHSRVGMTWKAIAQSHLVASSVGINEAMYRVLALAVGCFFAGIAGAWYAHYNVVLGTDTFGFLPSIYLVMYMLVGGQKRFAGPIIGTAILYMIPEFVRSLQSAAPLVLGGVMVLVVYLMPQGIAGLYEQVKPRLPWTRGGKVTDGDTGD